MSRTNNNSVLFSKYQLTATSERLTIPGLLLGENGHVHISSTNQIAPIYHRELLLATSEDENTTAPIIIR